MFISTSLKPLPVNMPVIGFVVVPFEPTAIFVMFGVFWKIELILVAFLVSKRLHQFEITNYENGYINIQIVLTYLSLYKST